jgi:glycine cleavage system H protein
VVAGEVCGELESSKAVSELYSPVSGTVTAVNEALNDSPAAINDEPYESGWIFKVDVSEEVELLDSDAYTDHIA